VKKVLSVMAVVVILGTLAAASLGSAADLRVQGGTIQAGADLDVKMYDVAAVCGWGLETDTGMVHFVRMEFAGVTEPGGGNELTFFVAVTDSCGDVISTGSYAKTWPGEPTSNYTIPCTMITLTPPVRACDIYDIHVYVEGSANSGPTAEICP
jgi:hypothetical protein